MQLLSWNVNGIRACINKGFIEWVKQRDPEILCLQETKAQANQISFSFDLPKYLVYWSSAKKKGYSRVSTLTKIKPISILQGLGVEEFDIEGRFLKLVFKDFFLIFFNVSSNNILSVNQQLILSLFVTLRLILFVVFSTYYFD